MKIDGISDRPDNHKVDTDGEPWIAKAIDAFRNIFRGKTEAAVKMGGTNGGSRTVAEPDPTAIPTSIRRPSRKEMEFHEMMDANS